MHIDGYGFGEAIIGGTAYHEDLLIFPDKIDAAWQRKEKLLLQIEDIQEIMERQPANLVIGTGYSGQMNVTDDLENILKQNKIKVFIAPTADAVMRFNVLCEEYEQVAALLHLT